MGGFLRSKASLLQIVGRAARHVEGEVIFYAKKENDNLLACLKETRMRRATQEEFNKEHGLIPRPLCNTSPSDASAATTEASAATTTGTAKRVRSQKIPEPGEVVLTRTSLEECIEWEGKATVEQRCDQLAIVGSGLGDDRICPGVPQIGRICAVRLLKKYRSLEKLLKNLKKHKASSIALPGLWEQRRINILQQEQELIEARKMIMLEWCYTLDAVKFSLSDRSEIVWGKPLTDWRHEAKRERGRVITVEPHRAAEAEAEQDCLAGLGPRRDFSNSELDEVSKGMDEDAIPLARHGSTCAIADA
jgi:hypothetical protein